MRVLNRFCWLVILSIALSSCASKKKLMQKSQFTTEIAQVERVDQLEKRDIEKTGETTIGSERTAEKESESFQVEVNDPTLPASVKKTERDGETKWELENIKNFSSGNEKSKESSRDTISKKQAEQEKSESATEYISELDGTASGSDKIVHKEKEGRFPWWWIALAVILYLVVSYLKETLNPLRWW